MKKIGILTFHSAFNYGAFLQCYSLCSAVKIKYPDADIEVIDYTSKKLSDYYSGSFLKSTKSKLDSSKKSGLILKIKVLVSSIIELLIGCTERKFNIARNKSIKSGLKYLPLSCENIIASTEKEFLALFDNKYDIIIVGSDAIWNNKQTETPNIYYLHNLNNKTIRMSFAASCYGLPYKTESVHDLDYFKEALNRYSYIGVRDSETENYIHLTNLDKPIFHNCDPSLFLDLSSLPVDIESVKDKFREKGVCFDKPIIGLMCNDWLAKQVRGKLGDAYQYIALYQWNNYSDFYMDNLSPFEWALSFSLFQATFTHYFHGTMFSLKNGTLTFAIEKESDYLKNYKTKIKDALERMGLLNLYYVDNQMNANDWHRIIDSTKRGASQDYKEIVRNGIELEASNKNTFFDALDSIYYER